MAERPTALVTGAASGIGRALATLLGDRGRTLHLADVDGEALAEVAATLGAVGHHVVDVADPAAMADLADTTGPVDVLCLNAGVVSAHTDAPWSAPAEEWEHVFAVNVFGVANGLRAFVPYMVDRGDGRILITASLAGAATWPGGGPYGASKHAVLALAEQAALELGPQGVGVTVLCPALVRTAMSDEGEDPLDVAATALAAVDEGRFAVIPESWGPAVRDRADTLVTGRRPRIPSPR